MTRRHINDLVTELRAKKINQVLWLRWEGVGGFTLFPQEYFKDFYLFLL